MVKINREFSKALQERCKILKKEIDNLTVDVVTGRVLTPEELSKDELVELVNLLNKYQYDCCGCI